MQQDALQQLLEKISDGTATSEEIALYRQICENTEKAGAPLQDITEIGHRMREHIHSRIGRKKARRVPVYWYAAAAVLAGVIAAGFYLQQRTSPAGGQLAVNKMQDAAPGGNKAVLTLANGKKISLSDAGTGDIARQAGLRIYKTAAGEIVYEAASGTGSTGINEIATPRGGQYKVVLQDGSRVWLNAASSLRYPATFAASERTVELSGEAYFEIAGDAKRPFKVSTPAQTVEVLGTHFNINAYKENKQVNTTLLEGSVKVTTAAAPAMILKPGEQASLNNQTGALSKSMADAETAIAWKNGFFIFNDTYLSEVMLQLSRWYDVQVNLSTIPKMRYNGVIPRNEPLSKVLSMLEFTGDVHFTLENNTISVKHSN